MQVIMLGPLMLKYSLLIMIIAAAAGYLVTLFRTRYLGTDIRKPLLDDLITTLLIGILVWKFSTLVFDLKSVIRSPLSLLYFTGGTRGIILAVIIGILILSYKCIRHHKPWGLYANAALTWVIASYGVMSMLQMFFADGGISSVAIALVSAAVVLYQFKHKECMNSTYHFNVSVMWSAIGLFAVSLLGENDIFWLGFSGKQLIFLFISILSLIIKVIMEKRNQV